MMSWQDALRVYALFGLLSAWLSYQLPRQRLGSSTKAKAPTADGNRRNGIRYALFIALITFISTGTSTHLPEFISHFGLPVAIGMLWGFGQTGARLGKCWPVDASPARADAFYRARHAALFSPWCQQHGVCRVRSRVCARLWRDKWAGDDCESDAAAGAV